MDPESVDPQSVDPESAETESGMTAEAPKLEALSSEDCHRLLGDGGVGRLAFPGKEWPVLRPVNFLLVEPRVVIRTGEGAILEAGRRGLPASFEIDGIDPLEHTGWSVLATGRLQEIPAQWSDPSVPLRAWGSGLKDRFVALELQDVTGLRIPSGRGNR